MKNTMKKSILRRVALLGLITVSGIYANSADNEAAIGSFGKFVYTVEKHIADFFNSSNKTSYSTFVAAFENIFQEIKRSAEPTTRAAGDALTKEIYDIIDYALQQFTIPFSIIKKYNGKPSSDAQAFGTEIKRDFNTEKVFGELISKLKVLKCKAVKANESGVAKKIETIIIMIEKKRKEWNAKADWVLFAGLRVRMDCR
jgi:hypothetical protein